MPSKLHVLNVLQRLFDGTTTPAQVTSPQALQLSVEPQANVHRYDRYAMRHDPAIASIVIMQRELKMHGMA